MAEPPKWHTERGGVTPSAPTTGFKPSTGGSAVVRPATSNSDSSQGGSSGSSGGNPCNQSGRMTFTVELNIHVHRNGNGTKP
jgi:hypothetical protein